MGRSWARTLIPLPPKGEHFILIGICESKSSSDTVIVCHYLSGHWFCCLISSTKCHRTEQCQPAIWAEGTADSILIYLKIPWVNLSSGPFRISYGKKKKIVLRNTYRNNLWSGRMNKNLYWKPQLGSSLACYKLFFSQASSLRGEELVQYHFTNCNMYILTEGFDSNLLPFYV